MIRVDTCWIDVYEIELDRFASMDLVNLVKLVAFDEALYPGIAP